MNGIMQRTILENDTEPTIRVIGNGSGGNAVKPVIRTLLNN